MFTAGLRWTWPLGGWIQTHLSFVKVKLIFLSGESQSGQWSQRQPEPSATRTVPNHPISARNMWSSEPSMHAHTKSQTKASSWARSFHPSMLAVARADKVKLTRTPYVHMYTNWVLREWNRSSFCWGRIHIDRSCTMERGCGGRCHTWWMDWGAVDTLVELIINHSYFIRASSKWMLKFLLCPDHSVQTIFVIQQGHVYVHLAVRTYGVRYPRNKRGGFAGVRTSTWLTKSHRVVLLSFLSLHMHDLLLLSFLPTGHHITNPTTCLAPLYSFSSQPD